MKSIDETRNYLYNSQLYTHAELTLINDVFKKMPVYERTGIREW